MTIVFLDVNLGSQSLGRIKIQLFNGKLPKTCENFRQYCTGEHKLNGQPQGYKNTPFHRVIKGFMIQSGDFLKGNGTGSQSIYGSTVFSDEGFFYKHEKYSISMANSGKDTNGCQFFICCDDEIPHLDNKHVVFGKVMEGKEIVNQIEKVPTDGNDRPVHPVVIVNCGEY